MAFSNVKRTVFGNLKVTYGDYTATEADTSQTIGVDGGRVYLVVGNSQDTTGAMSMWVPRYSVSTTGAVTTVTLYSQEGVTSGTFLIVHA